MLLWQRMSARSLDTEANLAELAQRMALQETLLREAYALIADLQQRISDVEALIAEAYTITFEPEQYLSVEAA